MVSFCKSCQANNVNTRVEWRPNPDKPGKKMMWDIDKNVKHSPCPFFKADPNWKAPTNDQAKEIVKEYNQKFPKENEFEQKVETALSTIMEYIFNIELKLSDIIRLAKGEDIEVLLGQKDEQIAKYKEIERERSFSTAKGDKA